MTSMIDKAHFWFMYVGKAPWDIERPQEPFIAIADRIVSPVLDVGCGLGENALFFASRGHRVTGIDFLGKPIRQARVKAADRSLTAEFLVKNALTLGEWSERFATVIDSGLFHVFSDGDRRRYVEGLATVLVPDGRLFLACFSDKEPGTDGPRRVSRREISEAFADGWDIESIQQSRFEVTPESEGRFSKGGPKAWLAIIRRTTDRTYPQRADDERQP